MNFSLDGPLAQNAPQFARNLDFLAPNIVRDITYNFGLSSTQHVPPLPLNPSHLVFSLNIFNSFMFTSKCVCVNQWLENMMMN